METVHNLKDIGVHSKRVPSFLLPYSRLLEEGPNHGACRSFMTRRAAGERSKMRPDMMVGEMTERSKVNTQHMMPTLPELPPTMPEG